MPVAWVGTSLPRGPQASPAAGADEMLGTLVEGLASQRKDARVPPLEKYGLMFG